MSAGNEPAYPWGEHGTALGGLTKREMIAAMAMQGLLANTDAEDADMHRRDLFAPVMAENAVKFADALLAALAEAKPSQEVGRG